jgi:hypothetical protein
MDGKASALERVKEFFTNSANANSPPLTPNIEAKTAAFFSQKHKEDILWWQDFFRKKEDPNGRIKIFGGIVIGITSTTVGAILTFSPLNFLPKEINQTGCKIRESGPAFMSAGIGILAGFSVQKF